MKRFNALTTFQIINRAPTTRRDEWGRGFPWSFARGIIEHLLPSPENITDAQGPRDLAPILRSLHQLAKFSLHVLVIFETLCPKMSRITKHDLSSLKQQRMIISRIGGKSGFQWQCSDHGTD